MGMICFSVSDWVKPVWLSMHTQRSTMIKTNASVEGHNSQIGQYCFSTNNPAPCHITEMCEQMFVLTNNTVFFFKKCAGKEKEQTSLQPSTWTNITTNPAMVRQNTETINVLCICNRNLGFAEICVVCHLRADFCVDRTKDAENKRQFHCSTKRKSAVCWPQKSSYSLSCCFVDGAGEALSGRGCHIRRRLAYQWEGRHISR